MALFFKGSSLTIILHYLVLGFFKDHRANKLLIA